MKMRSITDHTYEGIARPVGTVYEIDEQYEETLTLLKFAERADTGAATVTQTFTKAPPPPPPPNTKVKR